MSPNEGEKWKGSASRGTLGGKETDIEKSVFKRFLRARLGSGQEEILKEAVNLCTVKVRFSSINSDESCQF